MKVIHVPSPDGYAYGNGAALDVSEIEAIGNGFAPELIVYWYAEAPYEGSGQMVALKDGKWSLDDLSHCSCYGPIDRLSMLFQYDSLDALMAACEPAYCADQVRPLVEAARSARKDDDNGPI